MGSAYARAAGASGWRSSICPWAAIPGYLRLLAPERVAGSVDEAVRLIAGCERPHLSFDIVDGDPETIAPRVGLEGAFPRLPHREPRWAELVDRFVERGLCTPEKRAAVFAWPGWDSATTAPRAMA